MMKNIFPIRSAARIEEEASVWVARVDGGELGEIDRKRLIAWMAADRRHSEAFERLANVWNQLDCLNLLVEINLPPRKRLGAWQMPGGWSGPLQTAGVIAFGCALMGIALLKLSPGLFPWTEEIRIVETIYQTHTGEQSEILLSDGSRLTLNTRSEVRVRMGAHQRSVYLNTGEIYADVAPNPRAPFVVYASTGAVRAVGTSFNVRIVNWAVEVTVREGTVHISTAGDRSTRADAVTLHAGSIARYAQRIENPRHLSSEQLDRRIAWKSGKWAFDGQTLEEIVEEIGRYTDERLVIADSRIAKIRIGGYFDVGEIDPFLGALANTLGVKHQRITDDLIVLSADPSWDGSAR